MKWKTNVFYVLTCLTVYLMANGILPAAEQENTRSPATLRRELARMGFTVQDGRLDFPKIVDMCCECQLPTCFANNPSSPYGIFVLPPAPNQDPAVKNPYAEWFFEDDHYPEGWSWFWRMRADEAVIFVGTTPPRMQYFGFTAYLYDRYHYDPDHSPIHPPDCTIGDTWSRPSPPSSYDRFPLFASLGDTTNQLTVNVRRFRRDPFDRKVVFIVAADRGTERKVRLALLRSGYTPSMINSLPVPPDLVHLGIESDKDTLCIVLRMVPDADTDLEPYEQAPRTLLRVTPNQPLPPEDLEPIPPPNLRVKGTGETEVFLLPLVEKLGKALIARYPDYVATPIATTNWYEGYNCIENGQNCLGDNRDTPYIPPSFNPVTGQLNQNMVLAEDEFYIAYGVNHRATGKATYSNVSVLGWTHKSSPVVINNEMMAGSARHFLGSGWETAAVDKLYAYRMTRPCGCDGDKAYCLEVPYDCNNGIAAEEPMAIVFRAYLEPATRVAPAYGEIIIDRILKFTPRTVSGK